jgi:hypothetical protein
VQKWVKEGQGGGSDYQGGRQGRCLHQLAGVGIREGRCIPRRSKVIPIGVGGGCGSQQRLDKVRDRCHHSSFNRLERKGVRTTVRDKGGATRGVKLRVVGREWGEGGKGESIKCLQGACTVPPSCTGEGRVE